MEISNWIYNIGIIVYVWISFSCVWFNFVCVVVKFWYYGWFWWYGIFNVVGVNVVVNVGGLGMVFDWWRFWVIVVRVLGLFLF